MCQDIVYTSAKKFENKQKMNNMAALSRLGNHISLSGRVVKGGFAVHLPLTTLPESDKNGRFLDILEHSKPEVLTVSVNYVVRLNISSARPIDTHQTGGGRADDIRPYKSVAILSH